MTRPAHRVRTQVEFDLVAIGGGAAGLAAAQFFSPTNGRRARPDRTA